MKRFFDDGVAACSACHREGGRGDGRGTGPFKPPPRYRTDAAHKSTLTGERRSQMIQIGRGLRGTPAPGNQQTGGDDLQSLIASVRSLGAPGRPSRA